MITPMLRPTNRRLGLAHAGTDALRCRAELPVVRGTWPRPRPAATTAHDFLVPNPRPDLTTDPHTLLMIEAG